MLRGSVDPTEPALRGLPKSERDLAIAANNCLVIGYDNLSGIGMDLADALCRLATGGGFATRAHYTNDEEFVFSASRPLLINGIDDLVTRPDLASRSAVIDLPRIDGKNRRREKTLLTEFEQLRPRLLGALLGAVSEALHNEDQVALVEGPRMLDAVAWATAGETALGIPPGGVLAAFTTNEVVAADQALDDDPLAAAMLTLMANRKRWEGSCTSLLGELAAVVTPNVARSPVWPRRASHLSGRLRRLAPVLHGAGIEVSFPGRTKTGRSVSLENMTHTDAPAHVQGIP